MRKKWGEPGNLMVTGGKGRSWEKPLSNTWGQSVRRSATHHQSLYASYYRHPSFIIWKNMVEKSPKLKCNQFWKHIWRYTLEKIQAIPIHSALWQSCCTFSDKLLCTGNSHRVVTFAEYYVTTYWQIILHIQHKRVCTYLRNKTIPFSNYNQSNIYSKFQVSYCFDYSMIAEISIIEFSHEFKLLHTIPFQP